LHNKYDNFSMCSWKEEEVAASKLVLTERPNVYTWLPVAATPPQWLEVGWEFPGLQLVCAASMAAHKLPKYFNFNFGGGPEGKTHAGSKWIGGSVDPWIRGSVAWQMQPPTMTQLVVHFFGISLKINLCGRLGCRAFDISSMLPQWTRCGLQLHFFPCGFCALPSN